MWWRWLCAVATLVAMARGKTGQNQAHQMALFRNNEMADRQSKCQVLKTLSNYWRFNFEDSPEKWAVVAQLGEMIDRCASPSFRVADLLNQTFIFPGTKWCGAANVAENFHDLGAFNETDACCRQHDFCDDIIRAGRSKHNLVNPYATTRLHCRCDAALRHCFRRANSVISNTVGYIFFSVLQTQCFRLDHPAVGCQLWRRGAVRLYCVKYILEEDKPKKWQWFDQEPYF